MPDRLAGKAAIVTGGASGFGGGIVDCFAREGAKVIIADISEDGGSEKATAIQERGGEAMFVRCDVTDPDQVQATVDACAAAYGGVDVMVANAGLGQRPQPLLDMDEAEYDRQFAVNVKGVYYCCRSVLPVFRRLGRGNIIVTASGIALLPRPNLVVYGATKGAVLSFTKGLAIELAPEGFRVNALCPAAGDTPMLTEFMGGTASEEAREKFVSGLPLGRLISPRDMGEAAVFLASDDEAGTITGCALPVDSGRCI
ncbi:MAG: glucose 1-dehydrogenase [Hyphomicrobiaceae bacterium]